MIRIDNPDEIYSWEIGELWNAINLLEEEEKQDNEEDLEKVKYGIRIRVPIIYLIKGWYEEHPESKRITIKGHGKYDIVEFHDEVDEREAMMRQIILDSIEEGSTEPRN